MEPKITLKQENIPSFDSNTVAVKRIEYYPYGGTYNEDKAGVKAVEYFIRTGKRYPGIEWMC